MLKLPEGLLVPPYSGFRNENRDRHWPSLNIILSLLMGTVPDLDFQDNLNRVCDMAGEIVPFARALVFFWDEKKQRTDLALMRHVNTPDPESLVAANLLNVWAREYARPLLATRGSHSQIDVLFDGVMANSVLVVPLFSRACAIGSLQLFSEQRDSFTEEDAHLLWAFTLACEKLIDRETTDEVLVQLASTDFLTGLKTRRYFEEQLDREIKRAERSKSPLTLIMIDIDHFKLVNDTHGHHAGDMLLRDLSSILTKDVRENDTLARYGGEEFVIALPDTACINGAYVAQRLRERVEGTPFSAGSSSTVVRLTVSVGVASFPQDANSKAELLEAADAALYDAKRTGRNQVVLSSELHTKRERRQQPRLSMAFPVRVCGLDSTGDLFEGAALTVNVTKQGARLRATTPPLEIGSIVAVRHNDNRARFRVAWLGEAGTPTYGELGLQLVDRGRNIWGL